MMSFVNYYYSTSIWQIAIFVRKILQGEENKGVELTGSCGGVGEPGDEGERLTVDSPDKVGIFDLKLKVNQERSWRQSSFFGGRGRPADGGRGSQKAAGRHLLVLRCKLLVLWDGRKMLNTEFAESTEDAERKATAETDSKYLRDGTLVSLF